MQMLYVILFFLINLVYKSKNLEILTAMKKTNIKASDYINKNQKNQKYKSDIFWQNIKDKLKMLRSSN